MKIITRIVIIPLTLFLLISCATPIKSSSETNNLLLMPGKTRDVSIVEKIQFYEEIVNAFASIEKMNERNVSRLIEMTEIPAPPFKEQIRAKDFLQRLLAAGLSDVYIDEVGNVIARRPGVNSTRTVAIVAHMDTVFPAETVIKVRQNGNRFYAPGIGDNTRAMVVLLSLVDVMQLHDIQTRDDIVFIGSVGEEGLGDLRGVRHLFSGKGIKIDSFVAVDGGSNNRLIIDGVGSNRYRVTFEGDGGHSYGDFGDRHPHHALSEAIVKFTRDAAPITQSRPKATFSVGRIGGGTSINSIPFSSWMEVDMRSRDTAKLLALDTVFKDAVAYALEKENSRTNRGEPLSVKIELVGKRPAGIGDRNSSLVKNALASLRTLGFDPVIEASSTDANIPISLGVPAITISRGGKTRDVHSPEESWENVDSHLLIQAALLILAAEAEMLVTEN